MKTYSTRVIRARLADPVVRKKVEAELPRLSDRQQECLKICYGLAGVEAAPTIAEVAKRMGIKNISRLHNRAIAKVTSCFL